VATSLHSPCPTGGGESTLSRKTPTPSLVRSTMLRFTVYTTRFLGSKGTVSRSSARSLQNLANIVLSSLVPHGEVSQRNHFRTFENHLTVEGPGYRSDTVFNLATMQPYTFKDLLDPFQKVTSEVVLYLPRTSDLRQVAKQTKDEKILVMHYCMKGASKVRCLISSSMTASLT
jgi:hypothetical protein